MEEEHPEVSTQNLRRGTPTPVEREKPEEDKNQDKSDDGGFSLKNPFSKSSPDWKPTKKEIRESIFQDTKDVRQIPKMMNAWLVQAYMAGEKSAREGQNEADKTKLIAAMAIGFMAGYIVVTSGLVG